MTKGLKLKIEFSLSREKGQKMHYISFTVYMFGSEHQVSINTEHTLEEIENSWALREELCSKAVLEEMNVQMAIEET